MGNQYLWIETKNMNSKQVRAWLKDMDLDLSCEKDMDTLDAMNTIIKAKEHLEEKFMNDWGND